VVRDHLGDRRPDREVSRLTPRREFEAISQGCRGLRPSCPRPLPRAVSVGERFAAWRRHACAMPRLPSAAAHARITAVSRTRGTRRIQEVTRGHEGDPARAQEEHCGHHRTREDTASRRFGTVRPRVQIPGPRPKIVFKFEVFACSVWRVGVTGRSQIFLELGGGSPVQVDFEPSIELAHGYRTAVMSARARPQGREAPGFENQRRSPRRCAADAQVRTVRHPAQISKVGRSSRGILDSRDGQIDSQAVAVG